MKDNLLNGKWNRIENQLKARWSELTDDDLRRVELRHGELARVLQQRYSLSWDQAESDSKAFFDGTGTTTITKPTTSAPGMQITKPLASTPATKAGESKV